MQVKKLIKLLKQVDKNADVRSESFKDNGTNKWAYEIEEIITDYGKEVIIKCSE